MALDFPASPTNGQVYGSYVYNSTVGAWQSKEDPATVATVSTTAPASASPGDLWYDSDDGTSYMYYNDGTSAQWVELLSSGLPLLNTKADLTGASFTGNISAPQLVSTATTGQTPMQINSTNIVLNLNADLLDGNHASSFAQLSGAIFTGNVEVSNSGTLINGTNGTATFTTNSSGKIPIVAKAASGQTANLQEWQDSSGSVLLSVDSAGALNAVSSRINNLYLNRQNSAYEGGQINFRRSIDNADSWFIDVYGNTSTPSLRFINNTNVTMQIDDSGRVSLPLQPRFQAYGASGTSGTSSQDWVFPNTYVNVGSYYNTSNGRFTAPITGTYIFFWSNIGNAANTVFRYHLRKNGANIEDLHLRLDSGTTSYKDNGDRKAMINLAAGDYINIYFVSDNGSASYTSGQYPWFGGYLLG